MKALLWIVIILAVLGGIGALGAQKWFAMVEAAKIPVYRTTKVTRGDIVATISATGTLQPEESIDVGAQVAGRIVEFGRDLEGNTINNNSEVKTGMLLAKIDDTTYQADVAQANAQLAQDKALIEGAQANMAVAKAKLAQATRDWDRARVLGPDVLARETHDNYLAAFETAQAQIQSQQAAIDEAKAVLEKDQAYLDRAMRNLGYCTIVAEADGVIIDRRVNIGQTVVASLNSPSLFLLAKDLRHMWINVAVNEADIGVVEKGQPVTFAMDGLPDVTFRGEVRKKRLFGQNTQNVITYPVEVTAENPDRKLIPYQTANVKFEVGRKEDVLTVPNAALAWVPVSEHIAADARAEAERQIKAVEESRPGKLNKKKLATRATDAAAAATQAASAPAATEPRKPGMLPGLLWVKDGDFVRPVAVMTGLSDGGYTQVEGEKLREGMEIVTGEEPKKGWGGK